MTTMALPGTSLSDLLKAIAETLDIPDHVHEAAVLKYEDVAEHLAAADSPLSSLRPEIYPQGSFRLGTVIRPLLHSDEYDIDLVCLLQLEKTSTTQADLKKRVGDRLAARDDLKKSLEPCRRCWRLDFPGKFHMDVLPSIPNAERRPTGILLTDTELKHWQCSNPIAYAEWFYGRMRDIFLQKRAALAESIQASIEEVPEWRVRTPLQRAVQLLKRHRDIYFQNALENRPVSIIITTLAAHAYSGQADVESAVRVVVADLDRHIENRNGKWWVQNPVDPGENFADKWNEKPERRHAFMAWLAQARQDLVADLAQRTIREAAERLRGPLGTDTVVKAASSLGFNLGTPASGALVPVVPVLASSTHCQTPPWPLQTRYTATIRGGVYRSINGRKKLWDLTDRPVPKNVGLKFAVTTNVPRPYSVRWQVVNTGREAQQVNGLRGDFYNNDPGLGDVRWESTAYGGTHWVEAFIIKDGYCVARTGRKYVKVYP